MSKKKSFLKLLTALGMTLLLHLAIPLSTFANNSDDAYTDMNKILTIATFIGGFMVVIGIIRSGMKLASAQDNPQNRTAGIIGLCFAFLGGYLIFKAVDILNLFF